MADYNLFDPFGRDPWQILDSLRREMDQVFARGPVWGPFGARARPTWGAAVFPAVNLYDAGNAFVLTAELPGVRSEEVPAAPLELVAARAERGDVAGIHADLREERIGVGAERRGGRFSRAFELPADIDPEGVEARLDHGVLILRIPKRPELQPRRIEVKPS